ncbi:hypothetical protein AIOL_001993 [Candidatus Rhodobacter oscarellae]|uniref:SRPBCC family protein n=1 Tax=Candidatus Rhodobacter oscarellae TaxID=1675527 RepID=A0A0J9E2S3_9RHOB|nr:SRPBCC family protein [Candidatus Rhodobacter lobularis]KMW57035.1 hypothetical protein AIOL_001993 [Candidatus Rhodobacter lobularis]
MLTITETRAAEIPASELWKVWDNFANIYVFNPNITHSRIINGTAENGLGAERQCDLPGKNQYLRERVVEYRPEKRLVVEIFDTSLPMKSMGAEIAFKALGPNRTQITMTATATPKFGLLGRLMTLPMRPMMRRQIGSLLEASIRYALTGEEANPRRVRPVVDKPVAA